MSQKVEILNDNGEKLVGLHYKTLSKKLIILCHGYKSSKDHPALKKIADRLFQNGYSVFRFDFTGHGESEGKIQINIIQQFKDIKAVIKYFEEYDNFILIGASFSGFIASIAAYKCKKVSRLITINGLFYLKNFGLKYFLLKVESILNRKINKQLTFYSDYFKPELIKIPTLVIHVKNDRILDVKQSMQFYSSLKNDRKYVVLEEGDHHLSKQRYINNVVDEIRKWLF